MMTPRIFQFVLVAVVCVAVAIANPLPNEIPGPFVPGAGGQVAFRSTDSAYASYAIVNSDTFYADSVFRTSAPGDYGYYIQFRTGIAFPETNSIIDLYAVYDWFSVIDTYHIANVHHGFPLIPPADYFSYNYFPFGSFVYFSLPIPLGGYYWCTALTSNIEPGGYPNHQMRSQLKPFPIDYELPGWGWTFYFERHIRINEVKPFGAGKFIEIAQLGGVPICLDGWKLIADGVHSFDDTDTLVDYLVLYESDWDGGFGITDTCLLMLLAPDGTAMNAMTWRPWPDDGLSANIAIDPVEFWEVSESLTIPTPGAENAMGIAEKQPLPSSVAILSTYPEPFNTSATIGYEFTRGVSSAELRVFDVLGRAINSRELSDLRPGYHETRIADLPSTGVYLVRIATNNGTTEKKITFVK